MPTITDATVVAQAYDTSGNGGRKLVRLNDGTLYSAMKKSTGWLFQKSTDGINWVTFKEISDSNVYNDIALSTDGIRVFVLRGTSTASSNYLVAFTSYDALGNYPTNLSIDTSQTALGNVSLAINEAKTELHAAWASKNNVISNVAFNIRYAKGLINSDGTVAWGTPMQVTSLNGAGQNVQNPSIIVLPNGYPIIFAQGAALTNEIDAYKWNGSTFVGATVYNDATYTQASPSAIYVPQSINGLANGRIWVAWHGLDATDTAVNNIRVSYSDDGGLTWSAMQKLTSGNTYSKIQPSLTADKTNKIYLLYSGQVSSGFELYTRTNVSGVWNTPVVTKASTTATTFMYPSSLFDSTFSVNFSSPLFIYKDTAKVGFYGTWTVTTISVTPGDIGQKTDRNALLTYSITTDGTMSTITEKVNGATVNTRTATSGQAVTLGLTQEQWDAIRFGKYADATGGKNTLTVEMGSKKWTYTFDKRLATDADIVSAVKATKDANEVYLPAVKKQLADAINAKGGSVSANADWLTMIGGITGASNKRWASGTVNVNISTGTTTTFTVSSLSFQPSIIILRTYVSADTFTYLASYFSGTLFTGKESLDGGTNSNRTLKNIIPSSNGFTFDAKVTVAGSFNVEWVAFD